MKKLFLIIGISTLALSACSDDQNTDKQSTKEEHTQKDKKETVQKSTKQEEKKHKVTKKDGITYVDGHVFVNKKVGLPHDYAPGENSTARNQLNKLIQDGTNEGLDLVFRSGYRSYENQKQLYNDYVARDGEEAANQYSAKPGQSEHQTGLAFDVGSNSATDDFRKSFGNTNEGKWIKTHAHQYGFIIRYPLGKERITGYQYEPWHLRYVGKELAEKIYKQDTTLEEYFDYGK
ncbi:MULTISPECIES: M15 family metallopeptidase [Mammaliicoccus]|uniref:M15 family metallopeptidase n=1 Tax=Mammaliicoccus sciuri TaxID=1296 RepID=A0AAW5LIP0_MAMSC|nr:MULTISPECIES: M15 family metallopeptidase [Mammaliicoccus]MBG9211140.1 M15 family metallopeptidase [Mammaliicoccus sciuri]MCD5142374.1 M15 family metallopeptidase [Mammaliicoccus sciuri]MCQ9304701.1 M15 family metallopeptidase [Mammaliicoccus sciuri]MDT0745942.1 M15 family metallopeptidase [Mammaliicoccus sciuri]MDT0753297.1 M15 family metallopeptidase [Mammaliicoccus sciuri]